MKKRFFRFPKNRTPWKNHSFGFRKIAFSSPTKKKTIFLVSEKTLSNGATKKRFFRIPKNAFFPGPWKSDFYGFQQIAISGSHEKKDFFGYSKIAFSVRHKKAIFSVYEKSLFQGSIKTIFPFNEKSFFRAPWNIDCFFFRK